MDSISFSCPLCNHILKDKCKFCPECGNKLAASLWEEQSTKYKCRCGNECSADVKFCPECGIKNPFLVKIQQNASTENIQLSLPPRPDNHKVDTTQETDAQSSEETEAQSFVILEHGCEDKSSVADIAQGSLFSTSPVNFTESKSESQSYEFIDKDDALQSLPASKTGDKHQNDTNSVEDDCEGIVTKLMDGCMSSQQKEYVSQINSENDGSETQDISSECAIKPTAAELEQVTDVTDTDRKQVQISTGQCDAQIEDQSPNALTGFKINTAEKNIVLRSSKQNSEEFKEFEENNNTGNDCMVQEENVNPSKNKKSENLELEEQKENDQPTDNKVRSAITPTTEAEQLTDMSVTDSKPVQISTGQSDTQIEEQSPKAPPGLKINAVEQNIVFRSSKQNSEEYKECEKNNNTGNDGMMQVENNKSENLELPEQKENDQTTDNKVLQSKEYDGSNDEKTQQVLNEEGTRELEADKEYDSNLGSHASDNGDSEQGAYERVLDSQLEPDTSSTASNKELPGDNQKAITDEHVESHMQISEEKSDNTKHKSSAFIHVKEVKPVFGLSAAKNLVDEFGDNSITKSEGLVFGQGNNDKDSSKKAEQLTNSESAVNERENNNNENQKQGSGLVVTNEDPLRDSDTGKGGDFIVLRIMVPKPEGGNTSCQLNFLPDVTFLELVDIVSKHLGYDSETFNLFYQCRKNIKGNETSCKEINIDTCYEKELGTVCCKRGEGENVLILRHKDDKTQPVRSINLHEKPSKNSINNTKRKTLDEDFELEQYSKEPKAIAPNNQDAVYQKKDNEPENYVEPIKKKRQKTTGLEGQMIDINFYVVMSPDFNYKQQKDKVLIKFSEIALGGYNGAGYELNINKARDTDELRVLHVSINMEKELLNNGKTIYYRYLVQHQDGKHDFEFLYHKTRSNDGSTVSPERGFFVPVNKLGNIELWNQYDCMMHPVPENLDKKGLTGIYHRFKNAWTGDDFKRIVKYNKKATLILLPKWAGFPPAEGKLHKTLTCKTAEETLDEITNVYNCVKNLLIENNDVKSQTQFQRILWQYLEPRLLSFQQQWKEKKKEETVIESNLRLASALVLISLCLTHNINLQDHLLNQAILFALLMNVDDQKRTCIEYDNLIKLEIPHTQEKMKQYLLKYISKMVDRQYCEATWVFAIPLIHFLCNGYLPYAPCDKSSNHKTQEWWGEKYFVDVKIEFQKRCMPVKMFLPHLQKLFKADPMLPRSLVAVAVQEKDLNELFCSALISPEICLANLYFFLATYSRNHIYPYDIQAFKTVLIQIGLNLKMELSAEEIEVSEIEELILDRHIKCNIALDFLEKAMKHFNQTYNHEIIQLVVRVIVYAINGLNVLICIGKEKGLNTNKLKVFLESAKNLVQQLATEMHTWCTTNLPSVTDVVDRYKYNPAMKDRNELNIFSWLMAVEFESEDFIKWWKDKFLSLLTSRLSQVKLATKIQLFCNLEQNVYHQDIENLLTNMALDFSKLKTTEMQVLFDLAGNQTETGRLRRLMSKAFTNMWPVDNGHHVRNFHKVLKHLLSWLPLPKYLRIYMSQGDRLNLLDDNVKEDITIAMSVYEAAQECLMNGSIKVEDLKLILENQEQFFEILAVLEESNYECESLAQKEFKGLRKIDVIKQVCYWRNQELELYCHQRKMIKGFFRFCVFFPVDIQVFRDQLEMDYELEPLHSLCKPVLYTTHTASYNEYVPQITCFDLTPEFTTLLHDLSEFSYSLIFLDSWKHFGNTFHNQKKEIQGENTMISLEEIQSEVWEPAHKEMQELIYDIFQGTISLDQVTKQFKMFENKYEELHKELRILCAKHKDKSWIGERVEKIEQFHKINTYKDGAKKMKAVVDSLQLEGNFQVLDTLLDTGEDTNSEKKLSDINERVVNTGKALVEVTQEKANCIAVLAQCRKLINWLRELKQGTKEIKVLVDLAMMSAQGQDDIEVERVQCLSDVAMGYAPLIYELSPKADFNEFLKQCRQVWKSFEGNPNLPERLIELSRNLQWLKDIKKSHGSTELNALSQAQSINSRGIFRVGFIEELTAEDYNKTLDTVIQLMVQPEKGKSSDQPPGKIVRYSLQQLNDLQSRLMLVAGKFVKGKDDIHRFVEILDGITRLAKVYIQLCSAGSIIFKKWTAIFYCDSKRKVHTEVDIGLSQKILKGSIDMNVNVTEQIVQLCEFLESCLQKWTMEIDEKRKDYFYLNYFTTEQLVILRKEIAKVCNGEIGDKLIYPMLNGVRVDCNPLKLSFAIKAAFEAILPGNLENDGNGQARLSDSEEMEQDAEKEDHEDKREEISAFIEYMVSSGYSERLAFEALKNVEGPDCLEEGIIWCMENDDVELDDIKFEPLGLSHGNQDTGQGDGSYVDLPHQSLTDYSSLVDATTLETMTSSLLDIVYEPKSSLKDQLEKLWTAYVEKSGTTSVSDFLSVEHLGMILHKLAEGDSEDITRTWPDTFVAGKPNLIICPQAEVLQTLLSVFMYDQKLRLPTATEVLMCTQETRAEEVELLLRRCFDEREKQGLLFCLVNADRLDYEVSMKVESSFDKLSKQASTDYKLVVICSREREDKSTIVTAFDKFRVKNPWLFQIPEIQQYLHSHFVKKDTTDVMPAASIDPQSSCIRVVQSHRAGMGKTLKAKRLAEQIRNNYEDEGRDRYVNISLHKRQIKNSTVLKDLLWYIESPGKPIPKLFHLDIAHEVLFGVDDLLFNLLILGSLTDQQGYVWLRSDNDLYVIEVMPLLEHEVKGKAMRQPGKTNETSHRYLHSVFHLLPKLTCWSPKQSLDLLQKTKGTEGDVKFTSYPDFGRHDQLMDTEEFESESWQRVFQYLRRFDQQQNLDTVNPEQPEGSPIDCLNIILRYCGIQDPSWAELRHFVWFLNVQLKDCEESVFCSEMLADDLPGFKTFVVKSMIQMSRDFATRSLNISEETPGILDYIEKYSDDDDLEDERNEEAGLERFIMKRKWETSPHPYMFFNSDHNTMTFLGFHIDRRTGNMIDAQTGILLEERVMQHQLQDALRRNHVPLIEDFDSLPRIQKVIKLCNVMGNNIDPHDPDDTYVLTTDNAKKIMAIYMRFRCDIPVIIMGETGCGKTRLVKFMCDLQKPGVYKHIENMILMKVHGGTTERDIRNKLAEASKFAKALKLAAESKLEEARKLAQTVKLAVASKLVHSLDAEIENKKSFPEDSHNFPPINTVLFFDEANTTEEIGLIKQIMCDHVARQDDGEHGLKLVAACNPYRKHSEDMIRRLEQAGLGYHIKADETSDRLGRIPMRRLVYRVQALPQSMLPLVWDFGQLNKDTEQKYIQQMVRKYVIDGKLPDVDNLKESVSEVLAGSQDFMRQQQDECSFVSLRDVERALNVMSWFYQHQNQLFPLINDKARQDMAKLHRTDKDDVNINVEPPSDVTRSLILALGVCYHACLSKRQEYRNFVADLFSEPLNLEDGANTIFEEIKRCQDVFLDQVELDDNIARNQALKENVFMMIVCIELRIPLFLVGKPGSSKSLAKTIVADAMQGETAKSELFKSLKFVHMVSFQCSPLATPDGIVGTFRQCAALQQKKELDKFVSVVVLDEVGLAEDSPRMPLKTLHPLLEDGCEGDEEPEAYKKVAFIGISNWALDPAKMNRGILVQRGVPDETELVESARGISATDQHIQKNIMFIMDPIAKAYLQIYKLALEKEHREYFGLRDFYSIIKMVYGFSKRSKAQPTWFELKHSILRNFGGLESVDPVEIFSQHIPIDNTTLPTESDPDCSAAGLIKACLFGEGLQGIDIQSRYLLILTENYAALKILQQHLLRVKDAITIFGSSFPKDQEYTQVCRNINRIKICMETGQTVVLLNLENLYESLYDALNQYYVYFGGQQFVDLGLGTHRVKCRVHKNFRLIVVAEKQIVYKTFPIPLINRLEKHTLTMETMLSDQQLRLTRMVEHWAKTFAEVDNNSNMEFAANRQKCTVCDVFIGYDNDTAASIVLQISEDIKAEEIQSRKPNDESLSEESEEEDDHEEESHLNKETERRIITERKIIEQCKITLLQCATPESIVRLCHSNLPTEEQNKLSDVYFNVQKHDSLGQFLHNFLGEIDLFAQITTHSKLLSATDVLNLSHATRFPRKNIWLKTLQAFDTEQQFCKLLRDFFHCNVEEDLLLILQCDSGNENEAMVASARYNIIEEHTLLASRRHVLFIIQLPRIAGGCFVGFQGGKWLCYHIDDLHPEEGNLPGLSVLRNQSISGLFSSAVNNDSLEKDDLLQTFNRLSLHPVQESQAEQLRSPTSTYRDFSEDSGIHGEDDDEKMIRPRSEDGFSFVDEKGDAPTSFARVNNSYSADLTDISSGFSSPGSASENNVICDELNAVKQEFQTVGEIATEEGLPLKALEKEIQNCQGLDVDMILQNCIHSAAAMLEDSQKNGQRKTERVTLLIKLMERKPEHEGLLFLDVVKQRVALLLKDKEDNQTTSRRATNWLTTDAASQKAVAKAGTLRRSVWQHIENKVTPMLAAVLGYCDTDSNLDIISGASEQWLQQLWLEMLNSHHVTSLSYKDLQSATQRAELDYIKVGYHGCQGTSFTTQVPFSWTIKDMVEKLIHEAKKQSQMTDDINLEKKLNKYIDESPLGQVLNKVVNTPERRDIFIERYLMDFIRMSYQPVTDYDDLEIKLVHLALTSAASQRFQQHLDEKLATDRDENEDLNTGEDQDFGLNLPVIHLAYASLSGRLLLLQQAFRLWPEAVKRLWKFLEDNEQYRKTNEFILDILALTLLLEHIQPKLEDRQKIDELDGSPQQRQIWIRKVEKFQPLIERIIGFMDYSGTPWALNVGERSKKMLETCKCMWSRICAVQLLIEHVCLASETNLELGFRKCKPLWKFLREDVNFKSLKTIENVEKYLKASNISAYKHFFNAVRKCPHCDELMEDPVTLPCKHVVCHGCIQTSIHMGQKQCPHCKDKLPTNYRPKVSHDYKKDSLLGYRSYKKLCNSFFMAIVSQLCFQGNTPPEDSVIQKLLGYITIKSEIADGEMVSSQKMAPLKDRDAIDPTPVVRSFLLQLLLKSHLSEVRDHIDQYFHSSRTLLGKSNEEHTIQLALLMVHCLEDAYHSTYQKHQTVHESLNFVCGILRKATRFLTDDGLKINKLESIAGARFGLQVVSDWLYRCYIDGDNLALVASGDLFKMASVICSDKDIDWPRLYLIRLLNQRYGIDSLQRIGQSVTWLINIEHQNEEEPVHPDRFVVCGEQYSSVREAVAQFLVTKDAKQLTSSLKQQQSNALVKCRDMLLSLYTEVTGNHKYKEGDEHKIHPEIIEALKVYVGDEKCIKDKELALRMIDNELAGTCKPLQVQSKRGWQVTMMSEMITHFIVIINTMDVSTLMQPLRMLATKPDKLADIFIPTMPQQDTKDLTQALEKHLKNPYEKIEAYKCPNGHTYMIGDCGRPYYKANCPECGAAIGGASHKLEEGNIKVESVENIIVKGHILGAPANRDKLAIPERKMSPASTIILRLITHIAMYAGCNSQPESIAAMVDPEIPIEEVADFLWKHMECDINVLAGSLQKSPDDCILLMHILLDKIMKNRITGEDKKLDVTLKTKESRQKWEDKFVNSFISPILENSNNYLDNANNDLINDKRLGNNPLLRMIYESHKETPIDLECIENLSAVWKLRSRVSLEHVTQELKEYSAKLKQAQRGNDSALSILNIFLREEHKLRALKYLPGVIRLQQLLVQKYNGAIDRAEATNVTVKNFLMNLNQGVEDEEYRELIENYGKVWELVKTHLSVFGFVGHHVPKEYCDCQITMDTSMSMLLPSWKGEGISSVAVVYFLCDVQNKFLESYTEFSTHGMAEVSSQNCTFADLIAYDLERDLLPLIVANCSYTVSLKEGITQHYDFEGLAKQIVDRFLRGCCKLQPDVQDVIFREDFTNARVFSVLNEKIEQESMSTTLQQQIVTECRQVKELTESLARLDVTISFLVSLGHDRDASLGTYMNKTLMMKKALHSEKAMQKCCMKHVKSLWLLLSHERAKMLAKYSQDPFDSVNQDYKHPLSVDQIGNLHSVLHQINVEIFLHQLYECILLKITASSQDQNEVVDYQNNPLGFMLSAYIDSTNGCEIPLLTDEEKFTVDILVKHAVATWLEAYNFIRSTK